MKRGFTLIELLAVIVILAIIALIAIPRITLVVEKAKMGAVKNSALGYIDAIEKQAAINLLNSSEADDIKNKTYTVEELKDKKVDVKGKKPTSGTVTVNGKGEVTDYELIIDGYKVTPTDGDPNRPHVEKNNEPKAPKIPKVTYDANGGTGEMAPTENSVVENTFTGPDGKVFKEWNTVSDGSGSVLTVGEKISEDTTVYAIWAYDGPTKVAAQQGETHKGIMYLDPTNLSTKCNASNSSVGQTGQKTGCMRFYIYDDSNNEYKMILDHNTTDVVAWNSSEFNRDGMGEVATALANDTLGWVGEPRLITGEEVAQATNTTTFNRYDNSDFYFDGTGDKKQTQYANATTKSSYAWLYDYTNGCARYGCNYSISSIENIGYWTSSIVLDRPTLAWRVGRNGNLVGYLISYDEDLGVRPVITISKSIIIE